MCVANKSRSWALRRVPKLVCCPKSNAVLSRHLDCRNQEVDYGLDSPQSNQEGAFELVANVGNQVSQKFALSYSAFIEI